MSVISTKNRDVITINEVEGAPLIVQATPTVPEPPNGRLNVVIMGLAFLFLFSGFNTAVSYLTHALDSWVALASLSILYATFGLFNFISPAIVKMTGPRMCMFLGSALYILFILSAVKIVVPIYLLASALCGAAAAVLWTAQGSFLTACSTPSTMSFNSGLFFAIFQANSLVGPVAAIELVDRNYSFGVIFFTFFIIAAIGTIVLVALRSIPQTTPQTDSVLQLVAGTVRLFINKRMLCMTAVVFYSGASAAFFSATFPKLMTLMTVAFAQMSFGVGEVVGSLAAGRLAGSIGRRPVFTASLLFQLGALSVAYLMQYQHYTDIKVRDVSIMFCVASGLFGLGDACLQTMVYSLLGNAFNDRPAQAFAWYKTIQSVGYTSSFLIAIPLVANLRAMTMYFLGSICIVGFIGVAVMDLFIYKINFV